MLNEQAKREMLDDAKSIERRINFRYGQRSRKCESLDEYITFLARIQNIFGPFASSKERPIAKGYRL